MIGGIKAMNLIDKRSLFSSCVLVKDAIFTFTQSGNLPVKIDLNSREMRYVDDLTGYRPFISEDILTDGKYIYAFSLNGKNLLRWDLLNKCCSYFEIDCGKREWGNYAAIAKYEEFIYIFPKYSEQLIKFNVETGALQRDKNLYMKIYTQFKGLEEYNYFECGCQFGNLVWLFQEQKNMIIMYDMKSDTWKEYKLSLKVRHCVHMVLYLGNIYILDSCGKIYFWNIETHFIELLIDYSAMSNSSTEFGRIAVTNNKIYMLPALGKDIVCMFLMTKEIEIYQNYPIQFQYLASDSWSKYQGYCEDSDYYYFAMRSANFILAINKRSGQEYWMKINPPLLSNWFDAFSNYYKNVVYEEIDSIKELLNHINFYDSNLLSNRSGNFSGNQIWRGLKEL